jgi:hypothetical protein
MSKISNQACFADRAARKQRRMSSRPLVVILVLGLLSALAPARADDAEDQYLQVLYSVKQAAELEASGSLAPAKAKYQQALKELVDLQRANPDWNSKMVIFRVNNLAEKITALTEKEAASSGGATATNGSQTATTAAPTSAKRVKLLDPGAEPRKELRLRPPPDDKQALTMTLKLGKAGDVKLSVGSTVKQVADNGTITYVLVLNDISMSGKEQAPQAAEVMKAALAAVKGTSATGTVSSQGVGGELKMQAPGGGNALMGQFGGQMQDLFGQLVVPLPDEAVGVGAKWEVKAPVKSQGMTIDQAATYELVSLEEGRLTVKSTATQNAANQTIQNPAMPAMKVSVSKMSSRATEERTVDLAHVLPVAGSGKTHAETSATVNMGGQKQAMDSKVDMEMQFESQ